jgi:hypothetical protein
MPGARHKSPLILLFLLLFSHPSPAYQDQLELPKVASYQIDVTLDVEQKTLEGEERLTFFNSTRYSVDTLFFHLYPNAFRTDSTALMRESLFPRRIKDRQEYRGGIDVESIQTSSGLDLTDRQIVDETIMKLPLLEPLLPGKTIELKIGFGVKLPRTLIRMGYSGDDFMIAQWFPKMAVLQEDGHWNAHQYHFNSEFFADFGDYRVSITLPVQYVVGSTGYLKEERANSDSTKTLVFVAEEVHDFAWAASPDYQVKRRMVDGIEVAFFCKTEHQVRAERILDQAEFALKFYSSLFGEYPYAYFTIVDARIGLGGGAMEYPTLITLQPSTNLPETLHLDALVIFHETAHQWWYGMVASNEFEEAWLDEGFAEYSQRRALEERFGLSGNVIDLWQLKIDDMDLTRLGYLLGPQTDPVVTKSWEFEDYLGYHSTVYFKASLILETLKNYLGPERMDRLLKDYFRRFEFKHPSTRDFLTVVYELEGEEVTDWLEPLLYGTGICDCQLKSIHSDPVGDAGEEHGAYKTTVELRRSGDVVLPVEVEIELDNGERIRKNWNGKERWHRIEIRTDSKIKSAVLDPENKIALEIDVNNNSLTRDSSDKTMMKLAAECLFWLENWMQWISCF